MKDSALIVSPREPSCARSSHACRRRVQWIHSRRLTIASRTRRRCQADPGSARHARKRGSASVAVVGNTGIRSLPVTTVSVLRVVPPSTYMLTAPLECHVPGMSDLPGAPPLRAGKPLPLGLRAGRLPGVAQRPARRDLDPPGGVRAARSDDGALTHVLGKPRRPQQLFS